MRHALRVALSFAVAGGLWAAAPVSAAPARLPDYLTVKAANPGMAGYQRISIWVPGMGFHYGKLAPSLVVMTNNQGEVVGMEQNFPTTLPYHTWMDAKTTEYNSGRAVYSQHLLFLSPRRITPGMKDDLPSALTSFDTFKALNGRHVVPYSQLAPFAAGKGALWGPDGPGLRILLDHSERVVGGVMGVPAMYGWQPWFDQPSGQPLDDPMLGPIYTQTVLFVPASSIT